MGWPKGTSRPSVHSSLNDPDWLRARYVDDHLALGEVAALAGVPNGNRTTVRRALLRAGIPVRSISEGKRGRTHKGTPKSPETRARLAEGRRGKPGHHWTPEEAAVMGERNRAAWTPEKREAMADQRRGEANPMYGTISPRRGADYTPDPAEAQRRRVRKHRIGITHGEYVALWNDQRGLCAICRQPESVARNGRIQSLPADHDHKTGRIRGLLCHRCNVAIGLLREDPALFMAAATYLAGGDVT